MAKAIGIGGIFFKSNEPGKLANWYKSCLGFDLESSNVSIFRPENLPKGAFSVWSPFDLTTEYI